MNISKVFGVIAIKSGDTGKELKIDVTKNQPTDFVFIQSPVTALFSGF